LSHTNDGGSRRRVAVGTWIGYLLARVGRYSALESVGQAGEAQRRLNVKQIET
jgi:hypothetical protein